MDWVYPSEVNPLDFEGFVYIITNRISGRAYIGCKVTYWTSKRERVGESDWKKYWGSSAELTADIATLGIEHFSKEIICFCKTRGDMRYLEAREQFVRDVLTATLPDGSPAYYNRSILNRYFAQRPAFVKSKPSKEQKLATRRLAQARSVGYETWEALEEKVLLERGYGLSVVTVAKKLKIKPSWVRKIVSDQTPN